MSGNGTWLEDPEANTQLNSTFSRLTKLGIGDDDGARRRIANKIVGNSKFVKSSKRSKGGATDKYLSYPIARTSDEKTGDTLRIKCVEYIPPQDTGFGIDIVGVYKTDQKGNVSKIDDNNMIKNADGKEVSEREYFNLSEPGIETNFTDANSRINQNLKTKYYIELPIPQEVNDSNSVTWGEDRMNAIEIATLSLAQQAMEMGGEENEQQQRARQSISALTNNITMGNLTDDTQSALRAALSGFAINQFGSNVSAKSVISRSTGQILNNNLELLFSGVNLRSFPFSFTFSPRSPKESDTVKAIIRSLKMSMAAKAGEFNGSAQGIFLKSPDLFQLDYLKDGTNHPFLNRFKLTALTGMSVNYTNAGTYASYNDGTPVNIRMNLTFKEINPIYSEDYLPGNGSGNGVGY